MTDPRLRSRRRFRIAALAAGFALIALALLDHAGAFAYRGDDFARFNQKSARSVEILSGDRFVALCGDQRITVQLLGVDASAPHWIDQAKAYLAARLANREVMLRLDGTQSRNERGDLLAYVYITPTDLLNTDIVRDGQAFADRRTRHSMHAAIEAVENDARKKKRAMWKDLTDDQQPAWRREWLKSLRKRRA